jgi:hypothetical protein
VTRRAIILLAAALFTIVGALAFAAALAQTASDASYTTGSQSTVVASGATTSDWLNVCSQGGDSGVPSGYAHQHNVTADPLIASGQDAGLVLNWGAYPDANRDFEFVRVLTIKTPTQFPNPAVQQITVTVTLAADPGGTQPLKNPDLRPLGLTARKQRSTTITLGADARAQLDLTVHTKKNPWDAGDTFHPHVLLTVTYTGGAAAYFVYDYTSLLTIV